MRGDIPPPAASPGRQATIVGGSQARVGAVDQVTGAACYAEDIDMPGLLHAVLVRSPHPHARLVALEPAPATSLPGIVRVLTAADVPGLNTLEGYSRNEPLLTPVGNSSR